MKMFLVLCVSRRQLADAGIIRNLELLPSVARSRCEQIIAHMMYVPTMYGVSICVFHCIKPITFWLDLCGRYIPLPSRLFKTPWQPQVRANPRVYVRTRADMIYTYPYQFWLLAFCKGPPRTYLCFFLRCGRLWLCTALCISLDFDLVVHPPGQRRSWHIGCRRQRVYLRSYVPDLFRSAPRASARSACQRGFSSLVVCALSASRSVFGWV